MNTEQLKTVEELEQTLETICFSAYIHGKNQGDTFHRWYTESGHKSGIEKVVKYFASQESKRAVDEFKEKAAAKIYEAMHDGILKYGVRVTPSARDLKDLIDKL